MTETVDASDGSESLLIGALRRRDEAAFVALVRRYHSLMLKVADAQLNDAGSAEEVVKETWLAVIKGIDSFEGRSTLRAWIFRILTYQARHRRRRDGRVMPFCGLARPDAVAGEPAVDPCRFLSDDQATPFRWASDPNDWSETALLAAETRSVIAGAIDSLPDSQRAVISLRDLDGWSPSEVCEALQISDGNQRVLLHRARSNVQAALDQYVNGAGR